MNLFKLISFLLICLLCSCGNEDLSSSDKATDRVLYTSAGGRVNTLDPALAADFVSSYMVSSFYDTLLQYDYLERPYKLIPSMLESMPEISTDLLHYKFKLRNDLYFQKSPAFGPETAERKITSKDVVFSFLRIADARLHSPGFWLWRNKICGIDDFYEKTSTCPPGDMSPYDEGCKGFEVVDDLNFIIHLSKPDPRLLYALAMPYTAVASRKASEFYKNNLAENLAGSGPFKLLDWQRDYRIILEKNPDFRHEIFAGAENPDDRNRSLPLIDKVVCYLVKQPISGWLMFLQGELDLSTLDKDNFDAVTTQDGELITSLKSRDIKLIRIPEFQVNYVGFSFSDPLLSKNSELRKAISLAYNIETRIRHANFAISAANGPIPPGVPGYDENYKNPYNQYDLEKAKGFLAKAGFPGGINPKTGEALELNFDLGDTSSYYRQIAELMIDDMKKVGIKINPVLNNKPRFFQRIREGQAQLFRLNWVGDYPDAENFLQLFYGQNAGTCNRASYRDDEFDKMFQEIILMPDCPERTEKYRKMSVYLTEQCPWIFESYPTSFQLVHGWLENYIPHDFAYARWKYLSFDPARRTQIKKGFTPLKMEELRNSQ